MPKRTELPPLGVRRRACTNCTVGKAKCTPFSPGECERCHRLGKECRYVSVAATRKRPQPNSRLQVLERKIEELAARQEYQPHQAQGSMPVRQFNHDTGSSTSPSTTQWSASGGTSSSSRLTGNTPSAISSIVTTITDIENEDVIDRGLIREELAQVLLNQFSAKATQHFPFVVIPFNASLEEVRKKTPVLFHSVMAIMVFENPSLQHQLGEEVRQHALQRMIAGTEKSLDLLQGLLIYIAWYCHFYRADIHQELLMSQLCVTIAHELGIDKSKKRQVDRFEQHKPTSHMEPNSSVINAQMRAYLGTYCISCLVASVLRRRTALSYTKYMESCCQSLEELREYETDELIPHIVRSQELSRRILDTFSYEDLSNGEIRGEFLVNLTSDAFNRDLDHFRSEIPSNPQKNTFLDFEFHIMHIMINEAAFHAEFWNSVNDSNQTPDSNPLSATRTKMLWRSLNSCKDFINTFLSCQNKDLFYLTAFVYSRLYYVFITLAKLVFFDSERKGVGGTDQSDTRNSQSLNWSSMNIAKEADFQTLGKQALEKFTTVASDFVGPEGQRDAMSNFVSAMKILLAGYEKQINEMQIALQDTETSASTIKMAQDHPVGMVDTNGAIISDEAVVSTTNPSFQGITDIDGGGNFDMNFGWDSSVNTFWDDILENFTMGPSL